MVKTCGEPIISMLTWNLVNRQNFKNSNSTTGNFWKQWQLFMNMSWHHDCYSSIKDLALYSHWQRVFFFCSSKCGKKKEGEARTKKSKKKRMKINRWLQWRLWQFEQQCLKYTAAATLTLPEVAQLVWPHLCNWRKLNLYIAGWPPAHYLQLKY